MKKKIVTTVVCISVYLLLAVLILEVPFLRRQCIAVRSLIEIFLPPPSEEKMERIFNRDQEDLVTIKNYFVDSEYSEIFINESSYIKHPNMMDAGSQIGDVEIKDADVLEAIKRLFEKHGYKIISKSGNTIEFCEWTRLADNSRGIAYSINGIDEPEIDFVTRLEPLDEEGWYYYEADFNEWRIHYKEEMTS